ncbi:MAG: NAD(P)-dependent oxidoreductase [Cyanobacteria bacterium P01_F01_bin.33]
MRNIFITGASGCIGHYVVATLIERSPDHLFLLMRDPTKLKFQPNRDRITILPGSLERIGDHADLLKRMDAVVHLATAWGDPKVDVDGTLTLFELLDDNRCQKILYFSTESLLDRQNQPLEIAGRAGTPYIRCKYEMLMRRAEVKLRDRLITLYPTLVFGGAKDRPYSHITTGIAEVAKWLRWIRFLKVDGSFHFMHAEDIAQIVAYLLNYPAPDADLVLGHPAVTVGECIERVCAFYNMRIYFRIPVPVRLLKAIAVRVGVRLSEWDDHCIEHRHFIHETVDTETFHLKSRFRTIEDLLSTYG